MTLYPPVSGSTVLLSNPFAEEVRHSFDLQCEICRKTHLTLYEFACQFTVHRRAVVEYRPHLNAIVITEGSPSPSNAHQRNDRRDKSVQTYSVSSNVFYGKNFHLEDWQVPIVQGIFSARFVFPLAEICKNVYRLTIYDIFGVFS